MTSKGILLFAFNNSEIDYVKIAEFCANRAKHFLNMPVSIVTDDVDKIVNRQIFDAVIEVEKDPKANTKFFNNGKESSIRVDWYNRSRSLYYKLTPYDETLVLDVDYIVNSNFLKFCWEQPGDLLIYKNSLDLSFIRDNSEFTLIGDSGIDFYWATVFYFKKTKKTEEFFSLVEHIKENWKYYKFVYQVHSTNFRNDIAFSIAIHMLNGFVKNNVVTPFPRKLFYTLDLDHLITINDSKMLFLIEHSSKNSDYIPLSIENTDVHIMNKYSLLRYIENGK
jgi:hypothetical protein